MPTQPVITTKQRIMMIHVLAKMLSERQNLPREAFVHYMGALLFSQAFTWMMAEFGDISILADFKKFVSETTMDVMQAILPKEHFWAFSAVENLQIGKSAAIWETIFPLLGLPEEYASLEKSVIMKLFVWSDYFESSQRNINRLIDGNIVKILTYVDCAAYSHITTAANGWGHFYFSITKDCLTYSQNSNIGGCITKTLGANQDIPTVIRQFYSEKLINDFTRLVKLLQKSFLTLTESLEVFELNDAILNAVIPIIQHLVNYTRTKLTNFIPKVFLPPSIYMLLSTLLKMFYAPHTSVALSEQYMQIMDRVNASQTVTDDEVSRLYKHLEATLKTTIDWASIYYILTLPLLFLCGYLIYFDLCYIGVPTFDWLSALIMPLFFSLIKNSISDLTYRYRTGTSLPYYVTKAEHVLSHSLNQIDYREFFSITRLELDHLPKDWKTVQFSIAFHENLTPERTQKIKQISKAIFPLLEEYNIRYDCVYSRTQKINQIHVYASDVYSALSESSWRSSNYADTFLKKFNARIEQESIIFNVHQIFNDLKVKLYLRGFWLIKQDDVYVEYKIEGASPRVIEFLNNGSLHHEIVFRLNTNNESYVEFFKNYKRFIESCLPIRSNANSPQRPTRANRRRGAPAVSEEADTLSQLPQNEAPTYTSELWRDAANIEYSSAHDTVRIIYGTERYKKPIYVTHTLTESSFNSPWIYAAFLRQIESPKLVTSFFGGQGVYLNDAGLTVKILGGHGQGDVRPRATGFVENANGARLYIVNDAGLSAHR